MQACFVQDGQVVMGPLELPEVWHNISGLPALPVDELVALGWYPYLEEPQPPANPYTHRVTQSFEFYEDHVYGAWVVTPLTAGEQAARLQARKTEAVAQVNRQAGESRSRYITVTPGQEATYIMKEAEVKAYLAAENPVDTDYPILKAEADACGMTLAAVASLVSSTAAAWRQVAAQIEGLRRGAIVAIESATTGAQIDQALAITWP